MAIIYITVDWTDDPPTKKVKKIIDDFCILLNENKVQFQLKQTTLPRRPRDDTRLY